MENHTLPLTEFDTVDAMITELQRLASRPPAARLPDLLTLLHGAIRHLEDQFYPIEDELECRGTRELEHANASLGAVADTLRISLLACPTLPMATMDLATHHLDIIEDVLRIYDSEEVDIHTYACTRYTLKAAYDALRTVASEQLQRVAA